MKHLLLEAKHEIENLRRENQILRAKVEVVEVFTVALLGPRPSQGFSPDVAWALQKEADKMGDHPLPAGDLPGDPVPQPAGFTIA